MKKVYVLNDFQFCIIAMPLAFLQLFVNKIIVIFKEIVKPIKSNANKGKTFALDMKML